MTSGSDARCENAGVGLATLLALGSWELSKPGCHQSIRQAMTGLTEQFRLFATHSLHGSPFFASHVTFICRQRQQTKLQPQPAAMHCVHCEPPDFLTMHFFLCNVHIPHLGIASTSSAGVGVEIGVVTEVMAPVTASVGLEDVLGVGGNGSAAEGASRTGIE